MRQMKPFLADLTVKPVSAGEGSGLWGGFFRWPDGLRHGLAPLAVAIAFVARSALTPILQNDMPYLFFVPAVLVAAGLGGLGPGLVATGLGTLLGFSFMATFPTADVPEIVNAVAFVMIGAGIAWSGEQLQRNRSRAVEST